MVRDSLDVCIYKHLPIVYCLIYWDVLVLSFCFCAHAGWQAYFRLGFWGNQPRSTRFSCWNNSRIDQKLEKAITPKITDRYILLANSEPISMPTPTNANNHQHLVPK